MLTSTGNVASKEAVGIVIVNRSVKVPFCIASMLSRVRGSPCALSDGAIPILRVQFEGRISDATAEHSHVEAHAARARQLAIDFQLVDIQEHGSIECVARENGSQIDAKLEVGQHSRPQRNLTVGRERVDRNPHRIEDVIQVDIRPDIHRSIDRQTERHLATQRIHIGSETQTVDY